MCNLRERNEAIVTGKYNNREFSAFHVVSSFLSMIARLIAVHTLNFRDWWFNGGFHRDCGKKWPVDVITYTLPRLQTMFSYLCNFFLFTPLSFFPLSLWISVLKVIIIITILPASSMSFRVSTTEQQWYEAGAPLLCSFFSSGYLFIYFPLLFLRRVSGRFRTPGNASART